MDTRHAWEPAAAPPASMPGPVAPGPSVLDDTREFLARFIDASPAQLDAIAAWCAHTHVLEACFVVTPRLLITSQDPEAGKSETLARVRDLSRNSWAGGKGTRYAVRAKLDEPERPTFIVDEVSDVFGRSGRSGTTHPLGTLLREGYKYGATDSFASSLVAEDVNVFAAAAMAGRGAAVPNDVRSRSVVITMAPGEPAEDYLVREHDPQALKYRASLGQWAKENAGLIRAFRARGLHPKLKGRKREIWEPLFAIAGAAGGMWPRRILAAFLDLALDAASEPVLTPRQTVLRDMCRASDIMIPAGLVSDGFALGADLRDEMRRFGEPMYEALPDRALSMMMAEVAPEHGQRTGIVGQRRGRGYVVALLRAEWERRAPAGTVTDLADVDMSDPDEVEEIPARTSYTTSPRGPLALPA